MNGRAKEYDLHRDYIETEGIDKLIDFSDNLAYAEGPYDAVSEDLTLPFPPEPADLVRLHQLIRSRMCFTVLEFGTGYSTTVMADALDKNEREWNALAQRPPVRNRHMFQLFTVDTSEKYLALSSERIPAKLRDRVHLCKSDAVIGTFQDRICHYYSDLPDVVPDFIYLDGPAPKEVKGRIRGLSFQCDERTVMAADLLLMESTLLPGASILIDGRTSNARFLHRNFQREWRMTRREEEDVTLLELVEERLGKYNVLGSDVRNQ